MATVQMLYYNNSKINYLMSHPLKLIFWRFNMPADLKESFSKPPKGFPSRIRVWVSGLRVFGIVENPGMLKTNINTNSIYCFAAINQHQLEIKLNNVIRSTCIFNYSGMPKSKHVWISDRGLLFGTNWFERPKTELIIRKPN